LTWSKLYKTETKIDLGYTLDLIDKNGLTKIPAVKVYVLMFDLMSGKGDDKSYNELRDISKSFINNFPEEEQREIADVLLSYKIKDINKGDKSALQEVLELYDWCIGEEIILINGMLSPTTFRNYVVVGLRLGNFDRVEEFIKSKSLLLESSERQNAVNFNLSRLSLYKKNFNETLDYLSKVNYSDVWYSVNSRNNLLAAYYELREYDALEYQMESFASYLRREKSLDENKRTLYMNFIVYLRKLYKTRDKETLVNIKNELNSVKLVNNKAWLLEKIEELL